jgi:hypothetical protein
VVDERAHRHDHVRSQLIPMTGNPALLERHPHPDEQEARTEPTDGVDDGLLVLVRSQEVAVVPGGTHIRVAYP